MVINLGIVYTNQGKLNDASRIYERAEESHWKMLGLNDQLQLKAATVCFLLFRNKGQLAQAEKTSLDSWLVHGNNLGVEHRYTAQIAAYLCSLYRDVAFQKLCNFQTLHKVRASSPGYHLNTGKVPDRSMREILTGCVRMCRHYTSSLPYLYEYLGRIILCLHHDNDAMTAFEQELRLVDNEWEALWRFLQWVQSSN